MGFPLPVNRSFGFEFISRSVWQPSTALAARAALAEEPAPSPPTHQPAQDSYSFCFSKATSVSPTIPAPTWVSSLAQQEWRVQDHYTEKFWCMECFGEPQGFLRDIWTRDVQLKGGKCLYVEFGLEMGHQCSLPTKGIGNSGVSECGVLHTIPWHFLKWHLFPNAQSPRWFRPS